jgi:hypothetical protein
MIKGVFGLGVLEERIYFFFLNYRSYNIEYDADLVLKNPQSKHTLSGSCLFMDGDLNFE